MPVNPTLHQFSAGLNTLQSVIELPFEHPTQNGWKVYCDNFNDGATYSSDAHWIATANGGGTLGPGSSNSLVATGDGSVFSGYSLYRKAADILLSKKFYLETRLMLTATSVPDNGIFVGYTSANEAMTTTAVDALDGGDEAIGFGQVTQDVEVSFYSRQDGTNQTIGLGVPFTTAAWVTLQVYCDGANFNIYRDNSFLGATAVTKLNNDEAMTPQIFFEAVNAAANTLEVQYLLLAVEL